MDGYQITKRVAKKERVLPLPVTLYVSERAGVCVNPEELYVRWFTLDAWGVRAGSNLNWKHATLANHKASFVLS